MRAGAYWRASPAGARLMQGCAYVDGRFVAPEDAKISIFDWGFLHSDATYDVAHVWQGRFFRLGDHLDRFFASMAAPAPGPRQDAGRGALGHARVRAPLGPARRLRRGAVHARPATARLARPAQLPQQLHGLRDPLRLDRRPRQAAARHQPRRQRRAAHRARRASTRGSRTTTGSTWCRRCSRPTSAAARPRCSSMRRATSPRARASTCSPCVDGALVTPEAGVLEGISRRTVIEMAQAAALPVRVGPLPVATLRAADEVFLSSTGGGVIAVSHLDGVAVGGRAAPATSAPSRGSCRRPTGPCTTTRG